MKHLSDDDITKELEVLGQSFRPSSTQKENLHRRIFQPNQNKKAFRIRTWLPNLVSLIVLFSVGIGAFVLFNNEYSIGTSETSGKGELITDVTASWDGILLEQSSRTSRTNYEIMFNGNSLVIKDRFLDYVYDPDLNEKKELEKYKIKEVSLVAGEYTNYSIKKKNDTYTIKVTGKQEFTYTLEKIAPRKFVGEEGIEYSTRTYVEDEVESQISLVDKKIEVVPSDNLSEEINYKELVDSDIEKNINLNLTIENDFDEIQRIADIEIEKQGDMEMIKTVYNNTETGNNISVAQSTNELGNAEKYVDEIKNKWYAGEKLEELLVKDYRAIVRKGSEDESGLYVVTNDYVYSFIGDRLDVLLEMAENTPFK